MKRRRETLKNNKNRMILLCLFFHLFLSYVQTLDIRLIDSQWIQLKLDVYAAIHVRHSLVNVFVWAFSLLLLLDWIVGVFIVMIWIYIRLTTNTDWMNVCIWHFKYFSIFISILIRENCYTQKQILNKNSYAHTQSNIKTKSKII